MSTPRGEAAMVGHVYRSTFLRLMIPPGDLAERIRRGEEFYQQCLRIAGERLDIPGMALSPALLAVAEDLRYLERLLSYLGSNYPRGCAPTPESAEGLCLRSAQWAGGALGGIGRRLAREAARGAEVRAFGS